MDIEYIEFFFRKKRKRKGESAMGACIRPQHTRDTRVDGAHGTGLNDAISSYARAANADVPCMICTGKGAVKMCTNDTCTVGYFHESCARRYVQQWDLCACHASIILPDARHRGACSEYKNDKNKDEACHHVRCHISKEKQMYDAWVVPVAFGLRCMLARHMRNRNDRDSSNLGLNDMNFEQIIITAKWNMAMEAFILMDFKDNLRSKFALSDSEIQSHIQTLEHVAWSIEHDTPFSSEDEVVQWCTSRFQSEWTRLEETDVE